MYNSRVYPRYPIVGVGALVIHDDMVLLVKRGKEPGYGLWSIPGGVVELGEKLEDAVVRELYEETSVRGKPLGIVWIDQVIIRDDNGGVKYHYIIIDYLVKPFNLEAKPGSDVLDVNWFRLSEVLDLELTRTTRRLLEEILERGVEKLLRIPR